MDVIHGNSMRIPYTHTHSQAVECVLPVDVVKRATSDGLFLSQYLSLSHFILLAGFCNIVMAVQWFVRRLIQFCQLQKACIFPKCYTEMEWEEWKKNLVFLLFVYYIDSLLSVTLIAFCVFNLFFPFFFPFFFVHSFSYIVVVLFFFGMCSIYAPFLRFDGLVCCTVV